MNTTQSDSCFIKKLSHYVDLTIREREAIVRFEEGERSLSTGDTVYEVGSSATELYIVKSGWLYSYRNTPSDARQLLQIHHPGDVLGMNELLLEERAATVRAAEDSVICDLPKRRFSALTSEAPRIGMLVIGLATRESVVLHDTLQAINGLRAPERLLFLLLQIYYRLRTTNADLQTTIRLPMTQTDLGNLLGLTNVTISNAFKTLETQDLVRRVAGTITLLDTERAVSLTGFTDRMSPIDLSWVPPASE